MTIPYHHRHMPTDPYARAIFRIIGDHVLQTLDAEITTIHFRGLAALVEDEERAEMLEAFTSTATTFDDSRCFGTFTVNGRPWSWHFERMSRKGGKPKRTEVGYIILVISH